MSTQHAYNIAGKFSDENEAKRVYDALERALKTLHFDAHTSRIMLGSDHYVSFVHEGEESSIPAPVMQAIHQHLSQGQLCQLPPETIAAIQARRAERRAQGIGRYESHDPTKVMYSTPVLRDQETKEEIARFPELGAVTSEVPYIVPGSAVFPVDLPDLPKEIRAKATKAQADIRRKQQPDASATAKAPGVPAPRPSTSTTGKPPAPGTKIVRPLTGTLLTPVRKSYRGRGASRDKAHQVTAEAEEAGAVQTTPANSAAT
jgi:hypothetical protein